MGKANLIPCCRKCNSIKNRKIFWSIDSFRDYLKSGMDYPHWLKSKFLFVIPEHFGMLRYIFDKEKK